MADRYTYLPSLGPFLIVGLTVAKLSGRTEHPEGQIPLFRFFAVAVLFFVFVCLSYMTFRQSGIWRNSIELWTSVIEKGKAKNSLAYYQRAVAFSRAAKFDRAIEDYNRTLALEPYHYQAYVGRGEVFLNTGRLSEAAADFETAVALKPSDYQYHDKLGLIYGNSGRLEKAIESFTRSTTLNPKNPTAFLNLGYSYFLNGEPDRALENYNRAIEMDQTLAKAYLNRGNLFLRLNNKERAVEDLRKACGYGEKEGCDALHAFDRAR
jgi:tetratricopeptide (TPR) repeat protein